MARLRGFGIASALILAASPLHAQRVVDLPASVPVVQLELEPLYEVGAMGGPTWAEFASLSGASFGADGRLVLTDSRSDRVVVLGPDGSLLREHAQQGEGPGEYDGLSAAVAWAGGSEFAFDFGKRAFVVRDATGGRDYRLPPGSSVLSTLVAADGGALGLPMILTTSNLGAAWLGADGVQQANGSTPVFRYDLISDEVEARLVANVPRRELPDGSPIQRVFDPSPSFGAFSDGAVVVPHFDEWRIEIVDREGRPLHALARNVPVRRTTAADRDRWRAQQEAAPTIALVGGGGGATAAPRARPEPWFNPIIPAIRRVAVDGEDRIWVERPGDDPSEPGIIEIFHRDGTPVGQWDSTGRGIPDAFGPDGRAVWLETGEFDVPVARVYRFVLVG